MRAITWVSGAIHIVLVALVAFFMWLYAVFPRDSDDEEVEALASWLLVITPLLAVFAVVLAGAAIARSPRLMTAAWLGEFVSISALLVYTFTHDVPIPEGEIERLLELFAAVLVLGSGALAVATMQEKS
jgi:uncharacterized membrane protein